MRFLFAITLLFILLTTCFGYKFHFTKNDKENTSKSVDSLTCDDRKRNSVNLYQSSDGGYQIIIKSGDTANIIGMIGRTFKFNMSAALLMDVEDDVTLAINEHATLTLKVGRDNENLVEMISITWTSSTNIKFEDCYNFSTKHWYGGPEQYEQRWPINNAKLNHSSYVSKEADNSAVSERYWLNSDGEYYYVYPEVPLFVDYHNIVSNHLCFVSEVTTPYSSQRTWNVLKYDIWFHENARAAHEHAVSNYLGKPSGLPDTRMLQYPVWSTWTRYTKLINESILVSFADEIISHGFKNAQFEIDDHWEVCYGSLTVDETKFTNLTETVRYIKSLGFRVTIWIHPFINKDCEPWYSDAIANGYAIVSEEGSTVSTWWNDDGEEAISIDFTNAAAAEWWASRIRTLLDLYDIDSLKCDAGETYYAPQIPVLNSEIELQPEILVTEYVKTCAQFGNMVEVRSGRGTQEYPIYMRMVDKDSRFGFQNGLSTLITTLFQLNINGYTFVLPDMIGGNGLTLSNGALPYNEMYIRWIQANTFMPVMQYSYVPWDFSDEAVTIAKKYTELHADYYDVILKAVQDSVDHGYPVNAPIWWIDPTDEVALGVWDEYLLGETVLVAPVLDEGAVTRDIYLPKGVWKAENGVSYTGPTWIYNYSAPLDTLPYFVSDDEVVSAAIATTALIWPSVLSFLLLTNF